MSVRQINGEETRMVFGKASEQVRELFLSEEVFTLVLDVITRFELQEPARSLLGKEVGYAILGLRKPEELIESLTASGVTPEKASSIVSEVGREILVKIQKNPTTSLPAPDHTLPAPHSSVPAVPAKPVLLPTIPVSKPADLDQGPITPVRLTSTPLPAASIEPRVRTMAMDVESTHPEQKGNERPHATPPAFVPVPKVSVPMTPPGAATPMAQKVAQVSEELKQYGIDPYREPVV